MDNPVHYEQDQPNGGSNSNTERKGKRMTKKITLISVSAVVVLALITVGLVVGLGGKTKNNIPFINKITKTKEDQKTMESAFQKTNVVKELTFQDRDIVKWVVKAKFREYYYKKWGATFLVPEPFETLGPQKRVYKHYLQEEFGAVKFSDDTDCQVYYFQHYPTNKSYQEIAQDNAKLIKKLTTYKNVELDQKEEDIPDEQGVYSGYYFVFNWGKDIEDEFGTQKTRIKEPRQFYLKVYKSGNHYVSVLIIRDMDRKYPFDRDGMVKINGFVHPYYADVYNLRPKTIYSVKFDK